MTKTAAILAGALLIAAGAYKQEKSDPLIPDVTEIAVRAHAGDAEAQYELGKHYAIGVFVEEDDAEAVRWWRKATEQGHAGAMHSLGYAYLYGEGVEQDRDEAIRWFEETEKIEAHSAQRQK